MKSLTPSEEILMQVMWSIKKGFLKDIMLAYPDPKPHNNTVATVLKILVDKGFLKTKTEGRFFCYEVKVERDVYYNQLLKNFINEYYNDSPKELFDHMINIKLLNRKDVKTLIKKDKKEKKKKNKS